MEKIYYGEMDSFLGPLTLAATAKGLCMIQYGNQKNVLSSMKRRWEKQEQNSLWIEDYTVIGEAIREIKEYFDGSRNKFDIKMDLRGTAFQKQVWEQLQLIPCGNTQSYKDIAEALGNPKAVRAVGGANNKNPVPILIPCHRVIGADGTLTGYAGGISIKESLLNHEKSSFASVVN
ncbi:methylated-DNA--[protein]-cysteine S-methyltransferase [Alkalicoccus halolimnae]|uniref:Methylated-DNA--protein-cysteine methyltransferase n=1 Tax=Alkalicoccus halolimnae TaxID=1667239 RepID=A0A5C7FK13_9BACI|nr:methylated-DNA--[protein]-cysteine S-methyltransferase [Alkalicoccus halolimnae]TXF86624.1 methylated-DNA--[protein]-cysteine S-methyltransferase [Alkalicoccus halolimnae]